MNLTLSIDEQTLRRARRASEAMGKSLNQVVREHLQSLAGEDDAMTAIAELRRLPPTGRPTRWKFNRDEIHERS